MQLKSGDPNLGKTLMHFCCLLIHSIRGGTEVRLLLFFCICLKALQCCFKDQACATSVRDRFYLHCFIAHDQKMTIHKERKKKKKQ